MDTLLGAEQGVASRPTISAGTPHVRVAIVGAGFSGLGLAIWLRQRGIDHQRIGADDGVAPGLIEGGTRWGA